MTQTLRLILGIIGIVLALLLGMWVVIPMFTGIPWVPTRKERIRLALELAGLQPGETFYDLGCGDGRVLVAAARDFGARAVGIEISPLHCLFTLLRARLSGVGNRVSVRWGDIYRADLHDADVVYQYGHSRYAPRLKQQLAEQLRDGARFVSINVDFPGWQPAAFDKQDVIFLYRMPAVPGDLASMWMQEKQ